MPIYTKAILSRTTTVRAMVVSTPTVFPRTIFVAVNQRTPFSGSILRRTTKTSKGEHCNKDKTRNEDPEKMSSLRVTTICAVGILLQGIFVVGYCKYVHDPYVEETIFDRHQVRKGKYSKGPGDLKVVGIDPTAETPFTDQDAKKVKEVKDEEVEKQG